MDDIGPLILVIAGPMRADMGSAVAFWSAPILIILAAEIAAIAIHRFADAVRRNLDVILALNVYIQSRKRELV